VQRQTWVCVSLIGGAERLGGEKKKRGKVRGQNYPGNYSFINKFTLLIWQNMVNALKLLKVWQKTFGLVV
tara:strand:- start:245 stop:454 length:210 start_codon:yes stop_codon:yes gene_type:complete